MKDGKKMSKYFTQKFRDLRLYLDLFLKIVAKKAFHVIYIKTFRAEKKI